MSVTGEQREWVLWGAAAVLMLAVGLTCALTTPVYDPVEKIVYSSPEAPVSSADNPAARPVPGTSEDSPTDVSHTGEPDRAESAAPSRADKINLNTATKEELMGIRGIGEKIAEAIVKYRDVHGGFASVDELLNVSGIGEKRLAAWRAYFTV